MGDSTIVASLVAFNGTKKAEQCKTPEELINLWKETKKKKKDTKYLPFFDEYHSKMLVVASKFDRFKKTEVDFTDFDLDPEIDNKFDFTVTNLNDLKTVFSQHQPTPIERMMAYRLVENELRFIYQNKVDILGTAEGRKYFVCDFVLTDYKIVIETEGKVHCSEDNWRKDMTRQNFLSSMGYYVFRFGWNDVMDEKPEWDIITFVKDLIDVIETNEDVIRCQNAF